MNHEPLFEVQLDGVQVGDDARLGAHRAGPRDPRRGRSTAPRSASCAIVSGVAERGAAHHRASTRPTASSSTARSARSRPSVSAWPTASSTTQAIELTMLQAATHLDEGRDDPLEVATAKFWAADGGNRIGHAALHIHGGISIDLDYPIHRYFLWLKQYEFTLGSATPQLLRSARCSPTSPLLDCGARRQLRATRAACGPGRGRTAGRSSR